MRWSVARALTLDDLADEDAVEAVLHRPVRLFVPVAWIAGEEELSMSGFRLPGAIRAEQSEHGADLLNAAYFALSLTDPALVIAPWAKSSDIVEVRMTASSRSTGPYSAHSPVLVHRRDGGPSVAVRGKPAVTPTVPAARTPSAMRPWTPRHSALQRYKVTHHGTEKKRPASAHTRS